MVKGSFYTSTVSAVSPWFSLPREQYNTCVCRTSTDSISSKPACRNRIPDWTKYHPSAVPTTVRMQSNSIHYSSTTSENGNQQEYYGYRSLHRPTLGTRQKWGTVLEPSNNPIAVGTNCYRSVWEFHMLCCCSCVLKTSHPEYKLNWYIYISSLICSVICIL